MAGAHVIVTADDLGLTYGINEGIAETAARGVLTSTCLRVNGPAYDDAIQNFVPRFPHIGIGVHLNLVEGKTLRAITSETQLCHGDGSFRYRFGGLLRMRRNKAFLAEVELEFRDQIERVLRDVPHADHLNTHQHSHGIPEIFDIVCALAKEYGIPFVRLQNEPLYFAGPFHRHLSAWYPQNIAKWLIMRRFAKQNRATAARHGVRTNDVFIGLLYTGFMTNRTVLGGLDKVADDAVVEVLLHPATLDGDRREVFLDKPLRDYLVRMERVEEIDALTDPELGRALRQRARLTTFGAVAHGTPYALPEPPDSDDPTRDDVRAPLRTLVVIDETPFFHPMMLKRLAQRCRDIEIVHVAVVDFPKGWPIQKYLMRNILRLKLRELIGLNLLNWALKIRGVLPRKLRGEFEGSVAATCRNLGLAHARVNSVNDDAFLSFAESLKLDLVVSSNSLIFHDRLLDMPTHGCINRHSGLLPSYGGLLPVYRAIQKGETHTGVSVHRMVRGIDEGRVLCRKWLPIFPGDTLNGLYRLCFRLSVIAIEEAIGRIVSGHDAAAPPDPDLAASYFSYPGPEDWKEFRANGGLFI